MYERHGGSDALPRRRLTSAVHATDQHVVIEAPAGYGKTMLLRELDRLDSDALYVGRRSSLRRQLDAATLLVDAAVTLAELDHLMDRRVVVAARHLDPAVRGQLVQDGAVALSARDLRLDDDELAELLSSTPGPGPSVDDIRSIAGLTEGWPAAVDAIATYRASDPAANWGVYGPHLDQLVDASLASLTAVGRRDFAQLCHLGTFTKGCIDALASLPDVATLLEGGCPLLRGADGWIRVPRVMTLWARSAHPIDRDTILAVAPVLLATASPERALRALIGADLVHDAAVMMADLPERQIDHLGPSVGHALLDIVERYADELPTLHLFRARLYRNTAQFAGQASALAQAERSSDQRVAAQAKMELLVMESRQGWDEQSEARLADALQMSAPTGATTATVAEIRAFAAAHDPDPRVVRSALAQFERAAAAWELQGDERRAAAVLRSAATTSLFHLGEYREAARVLERAADLCWNYPLDRAVTTVLRCRFGSLSGELSEFERLAPEAESLAAATGLDWMRGYLEWSHMWAATWRADRRSVQAHQRDAAHYLGELSTTPTGHLFLAESATCLALVGEHELAHRLLQDSAAVRGTEIERQLAELIVAARSSAGADVDDLAEALITHPHVPTERHWRVWLEQLRRVEPGDDRAAPLTSDVNKYAERQGLGVLRDLLLADASEGATTPTARLSVLGRFGVEVDGAEVDAPSGHVETTLKVLAVHRGDVSVDRLADILWPEAWSDEGRQRLKNVVKRVRDVLGAEAVVRRGDKISLAPDVAVDLAEFYEQARVAMQTTSEHDDGTVRQIVRALGMYDGPLLPSDEYDDWVQPARQSARAQAEALLAQLYVVPSSQRPPATWLLSTLVSISPDDDRQLARVARLALDEGDHATARSALRMAKVAARAVDVDLVVDDDELDAMIAMV